MGLSSAPPFEAAVSLKTEAAMALEAVVQTVGEEHAYFVSVGHGLGGLFAWSASRLAPRLHRGLVLLDGLTPEAFRQCPELVRRHSPRPSLLETVLQQSGLRRLLSRLDASSLRLPGPPTPPEAVALHRHCVLTDRMALAVAAAHANARALAAQLFAVSESGPAVFVASTQGCANKAGAAALQKYHKKSKVIQSDTAKMEEATQAMLEAAKFIVENQQQ